MTEIADKHGEGEPHRKPAAPTSAEATFRQEFASLPDAGVQTSLEQVSGDSAPESAPNAQRPGIRYRILRAHARGGLGAVFVAEDTELGRNVALKEIQAAYADNPENRSRFVLEAEITGGLEHPGIVPVYGLGTYPDGRPFYAMRFIKGDNLKDAIARFHNGETASPPVATGGSTQTHPLPRAGFDSLEFRQLLRRIIDVCNAVAYAHSRGVLHRDLKPADRYDSALTLAADLERWLADQPVSAWREPLAARARRWVRRHARLVTGLGAALAVGVVSLSLLALERERARRAVAAEQAVTKTERDEKSAALEIAEKRLGQVERGIGILTSVFIDLDPRTESEGGKPLRVLLGERLDEAANQLTGETIGDPVAVARLQLRLGSAQASLGNPRKALELFAAARTTFSSHLGPDHADTLHSMNDLAFAYHLAGEMDAALPLLEETFKLRKAKLGPDHQDTLTSMGNLAAGYLAVGNLNDALPLFEESLKITTKKMGAEHTDTMDCMGNLAERYGAAGKMDAAMPLLQETFRLRKARYGTDHPEALVSMINLAGGYRDTGKLDEAGRLYQTALPLFRASVGPDHPNTLACMGNLAGNYRATGKLDAALALYEETIKVRTAKQGLDHPDTINNMGHLASTYLAAKQTEKGLHLFGELLAVQKKRLAGKPQKLTEIQLDVAGRLLKAGQFAAAEPILRECLQCRESQEPDAWTTFNTRSVLGGTLTEQKKYADAEPLLVAGYEGMKVREAKIPPTAKVRLNEAVERLVGFYAVTGKPDEAARWREKLPPSK